MNNATKNEAETIALEEFGMTFRLEQGEWISYPTNIDGTCDFDEGTAVGLSEWEDSTPEEIEFVRRRVHALLKESMVLRDYLGR